MSYKNFRETDLMDEALQKENFDSARCVIANLCPFDRAFTTGMFEDALEYAHKVKGVNLYVSFDVTLNPLYEERVARKDPNLEEDDFAYSVAYLKENFCPERIEDTKKLGRYLFPEEMRHPRVEMLRPTGSNTTRTGSAPAGGSQQRATGNPTQSGHTKKVWPLVAGIAAAAVLVYLLIK